MNKSKEVRGDLLKQRMFLFACALLVSITSMTAQTIKGKVIAESGLSRPFVNVLKKHSVSNVSTDDNRGFMFSVKSIPITAVFFSVGLQ